MEAAVHVTRLVHQIEQGSGKQGEDLLRAPIVTNIGDTLALAPGLRPMAVAVDRIQPFQDVRHVLRPRLPTGEAFANTG